MVSASANLAVNVGCVPRVSDGATAGSLYPCGGSCASERAVVAWNVYAPSSSAAPVGAMSNVSTAPADVSAGVPVPRAATSPEASLIESAPAGGGVARQSASVRVE